MLISALGMSKKSRATANIKEIPHYKPPTNQIALVLKRELYYLV
jgi:hypothetical protein